MLKLRYLTKGYSQCDLALSELSLGMGLGREVAPKSICNAVLPLVGQEDLLLQDHG